MQFVLICGTITVLLLLAILIILPLKIRFCYQRNNYDDVIRLELAIWRLPSFKVEITTLDLKTQSSGLKVKLGGKTKNRGELVRRIITTMIGMPGKKDNLTNLDTVLTIPLDFDKLKKKAEQAMNLYHRFSPAAKYLLSRTHCRCFKWSTRFGTGDAAATGLLAGFVWTLKTLLLSMLFRYIVPPAKKPDLKIEPNFQHAELHTDLDCLFEVRNYWILLTGIKLVIPKKSRY